MGKGSGKTLVFVYGTLKRGHPNHHVLAQADSSFLMAWATSAEYEMIDLGPFPAVREGGGTAICGEIYAVGDLAPIDRLEGYPVLYDRRLIETPCGQAWLYVMNDALGEVIPSGEWAYGR
ncbi:gamma-glutamylcyclotransferase family protein [Halorhodospira halochloris]|uniref:gamma-glutamylcyclotransferase family protein n=1 Tax=Halorhodospira halochloris TaxID=1052 RepID=UPI001EE82600|nr:gamma-glutamylcyclotransferase family protein [Halorhodospira halochloris]MCG5549440.1 gamma-glutamylcyclotransferase [Halorhodospira halochloris]